MDKKKQRKLTQTLIVKRDKAKRLMPILQWLSLKHKKVAVKRNSAGVLSGLRLAERTSKEEFLVILVTKKELELVNIVYMAFPEVEIGEGIQLSLDSLMIMPRLEKINQED